MKRVYIESLGCPKNLVDSELFAYHIEKNYNWSISNSPDEADIILINTCGFIEPAKEESINKILEFANSENKEIYVIGCLVNRYKKILKKSIPEVEKFLTIKESFSNFVGITDLKKIDFTNRKIFTPLSFAYVKIADGCDRRCGYCAIPEIKGPLKNRPADLIIKEIKNLVALGYKEIILVANDLISYSDSDGNNILNLLEKIDKIENLYKVRLLYLYPDRKILDIVKFIKNSDKFCKYIEMPVQHISSKILERMKRPSEEKFYFDLIDNIRKSIEDIVLRTTFIIGFPGETNKDFKKLKNFLSKIKFNWVGFFKYSDEEGTYASKLKDKLSDYTISKRYEEIIEFQREITSNWLHKRVGKTYDILVDEILPESDIILCHSEFEAPEIDGNIIIKYDRKIKEGDILKVNVKESFDYDLFAEKN